MNRDNGSTNEDWFIDVRLTLKAQLPKKCSKCSAKASDKDGCLSKRSRCLKKNKLYSLTFSYVTGCTNIMLAFKSPIKSFESPKKTEKKASLNT